MEILVIGSEPQLKEVMAKFGETHQYVCLASEATEVPFGKYSVVFDFVTSDQSASLYKDHPSLIVFADTTFCSLSQWGADKFQCTVFGFCGLPTFLNREILETSLSTEDHRPALERICLTLSTKYQIVADKVGLVTPRVICMIINEAYYTVEEGTATKDDIDLAMKLGTNYPYGPFEWCTRIGSRNVCRLLEAMFSETKDSRYTICSSLLSKLD
ncbi:hypothetical protein BH10BAC4_BH10BAC4_23140 [soil metagenome]